MLYAIAFNGSMDNYAPAFANVYAPCTYVPLHFQAMLSSLCLIISRTLPLTGTMEMLIGAGAAEVDDVTFGVLTGT